MILPDISISVDYMEKLSSSGKLRQSIISRQNIFIPMLTTMTHDILDEKASNCDEYSVFAKTNMEELTASEVKTNCHL